MNASTARDDLMPRAPDARGRGLLLAVLVHLALVGALMLGINWKTSEPDAVEAELWAAVPQAAAPAPPAPQPRPEPRPEPKPEPTPPVQRQAPDRDAELALEKRRQEEQARKLEAERREREARERREAERKEAERRKREEAERVAAEKKKAEEERRKREEQARLAAEQQKRIEAMREERLARLTSQAGTGTASTGVSNSANAGSGSPSAGWVARLRAKVRPNIVFTDTYTGNPAADVEVRAAPDGTILGTRLVKPSGNAEWDQAVLRALDKTQTLPRDENGRVPTSFIITFRPQD